MFETEERKNVRNKIVLIIEIQHIHDCIHYFSCVYICLCLFSVIECDCLTYFHFWNCHHCEYFFSFWFCANEMLFTACSKELSIKLCIRFGIQRRSVKFAVWFYFSFRFNQWMWIVLTTFYLPPYESKIFITIKVYVSQWFGLCFGISSKFQ